MQRFFAFMLLIIMAVKQDAAAQQTKKDAASTKIEASTEDVKIDPIPSSLPFDSTAAPNDDLTKAIRQMLVSTDAVNTGINTAVNLLKQQEAANTSPEMTVFYTRFSEVLKSERTKNHFANIYVKVYRKYFTLEEVQQLTAFYKTPLGKKTLEVIPLSMQENYTEGAKLGRMLASEILKELEIE